MRFPPFEKVTEIAEEAKPGPLQDPPEQRTGDAGKRRFMPHRRVNSIRDGDNPENDQSTRSPNNRAETRR